MVQCRGLTVALLCADGHELPTRAAQRHPREPPRYRRSRRSASVSQESDSVLIPSYSPREGREDLRTGAGSTRQPGTSSLPFALPVADPLCNFNEHPLRPHPLLPVLSSPPLPVPLRLLLSVYPSAHPLAVPLTADRRPGPCRHVSIVWDGAQAQRLETTSVLPGGQHG